MNDQLRNALKSVGSDLLSILEPVWATLDHRLIWLLVIVAISFIDAPKLFLSNLMVVTPFCLVIALAHMARLILFPHLDLSHAMDNAMNSPLSSGIVVAAIMGFMAAIVIALTWFLKA